MQGMVGAVVFHTLRLSLVGGETAACRTHSADILDIRRPPFLLPSDTGPLKMH